jgi:PAS domain S-box-containing protein
MLQDTQTIKGLQVFASDKWAEMTGYSKEELANMSFFDLVNPTDRESCLDRHNRKMGGEIISDLIEVTIIKKDGCLIPMEFTSAVNLYNGKKVNIAYFRDISKRKIIENKLKLHQDHLEEQIDLRIAELQRVKTELEKAYEAEKKLRLEVEDQIKSKTNLVRAMVHELKTPLTPMIGTSTILSDRLDDVQFKRMAKNIKRGAENLNRRIADLIDYVSGSYKEISLHYKKFDPIKLLTETVSLVAPEAEIKRQHLLLDIKGYIAWPCADEERIRQVILNILGNALKFTPTDGRIIVSA